MFNGSGSYNSNLNSILDMIKNGRKTADGRNIIYDIDDKTRIMFRLDVGENAHEITDYGYDFPVNHGNIEIQAANAKGKYQTKWDYHIIFDENGNVDYDKRFETGKWTEWTKNLGK
ncbi:hypothetical protein CLOBI_46320 [Clostridium beijerinckii]|nr:hypothetical protein CLOBI_46320 [Clostridium beijerinckii]